MSLIENLILEVETGVRKWVLIAFVISILLALPSYLLSTQLVNFWFYNASFNSNRFVPKNIVIPKTVSANEFRLDTSNYVDLSSGKRLIYTFIDNRANRTVGYNPFYYKQQVIDKNNNVLAETLENSFLLPSDAKYISAYSDNPNAVALTIQMQPNTKIVDYNPNSSTILKNPELEIRDKTVIPKDKNTITLRTSIKNPTKFTIKTLNIVMLVRDSQDSIVGVQDYSISGLVPNEEREVKIDYPAPKNRTPKSLDVRTWVNYLDSSNIKTELN